MNRAAFAASLIAALIGAGLLWLYKQRFENEVSGGQKIAVLMATQDLELGSRLSAEMVAVRGLPEAYVEDRHIRASDASRIVGLPVRTRLRANESLLWSDVAANGAEARDLAGLVAPGMRAVAIPADISSAFSGLLRPGDRVDALLTTIRAGTEDEQVTLPLLQNLLVLATGADVGGATEDPADRRGQRTGRSTVTLGVTSEQAQLLTFSLRRGTITLALRHPGDIAVIEDLPETTITDILEPAKRQYIQRSRPKREMPGIERVESPRR
jgi:pilus assembly protein CpaB